MEKLKSSADIKIGEYYWVSPTSLYKIINPDFLDENKIYCRIFNDVINHQICIVYIKNNKSIKKVIVDDFLTIEFVLGKLKDE
jgi:hypothetical protein